jgi:hypothetical protein
MALPSLERTWQYNVNQQVAPTSLTVDLQNLMYLIKASLVGFISSPWTVVSSSDGTSNFGASDYWSDYTKLVWTSAGSNHSWIVLQQTGVASTFQILIDLSNYTQLNCNILMSFAGFTGGSLTAAPTASDSVTILSNSSWIYYQSSVNTILDVWMDSTGKSTRVVILAGSTVRSMFFIEYLADSPLTNKAVGVCKSSSGEVTLGSFQGSAYWAGRYSSINFTGYTCSEAYGTTNSQSPVVNQASGSISNFSGAYPISPLSVFSATGGATGRAGRLVDMWAGSSSIATGSTYPAAGLALIQLNQFVLPWDGVSTPVIA